MQKSILVILLFVGSTLFQKVAAQEINATVNILSPSIQMTNKEIFTTLETSVRQFVNSFKWSNQSYELEERIECAFIMTITSYQNNSFNIVWTSNNDDYKNFNIGD